MKWFRNHWFDIGGFLAIAIVILLMTLHPLMSYLQWLLWLNLVALFVHQLEEYKYPGTFPQMLNTVLFKSDLPNRYPLNTNTSMIINVGGWLICFFGALLADKVVAIGIIALMISAGNFMAHTFLFNIKGRSFYNPGLLTSWLLFLPVVILFFMNVVGKVEISTVDWVVGVAGGILVNAMIPFLINRLKDRGTRFVFER